MEPLYPGLHAYLPRAGQSSQQPLGTDSIKPLKGGDPLREIRYLAGLGVTQTHNQWRTLKQIRPHVVILRSCRYTSLIGLCRLLGIPIILEVNAPMLERALWQKTLRFRGLPFWCWLEARVFGLADHIYVVSSVLRKYYLDYGLPPQKVSVVPNGVDTQRFHPEVHGTQVRRELGLEDRLVIGFSGSFTPWQGFDHLAEATSQLVSQRPDLKKRIALLMVGKKASDFDIKGIKHIRVAMPGPVTHEQMPEYLAAMDIITAPYAPIQPFYFSPLKVLEAMAMGKPVVASDQGQISTLISHNVSGLLYEPGNKAALRQALLTLVDNPALRRHLGQNTRRIITNGYTWRTNAKNILSLCHQVGGIKLS